MEWYIWLFIITCINALFITTIVDVIVMGHYVLKLSTSCKLSQYVICKENRIDLQNGNECSGYATAYLLRHFGVSAIGTEVYQKMPFKDSAGCVPPKGIKKVLESYGFHAKYCAGNLNALKNEISKGTPVIVFIKVRKDKRWLHYVPVVGYDANNLFLTESASGCVNCNEKAYNRKINQKEFMTLWNTAMLKMPFYARTFYVIEQHTPSPNTTRKSDKTSYLS